MILEAEARAPRASPLRIVVSYPGLIPCATEAACAFLEADMLARYETTFVHETDGTLARVLDALPRSKIARRVSAELMRRALPEVPKELVHRQPFWDLTRVAASRLHASDVWLDRIWERCVLSFDRGVAERLAPGVNAVYGYEHACRASFERARALGMYRLFDMASPHYAFMERVLDKEHEEFPEIGTEYFEITRRLAAERNAHKQAELDLADLVIANSSFTARALIETGYAPERVRIVSYGAPAPDPRWRARETPRQTTVLFAGTVSVRKGAHHLLNAWRRVQPLTGNLTLAGTWTLPESLLAALPASVHILGSIPRAALYEQYLAASVLVLPSLCDGFGLVVTEALAHGLPVITTHNVGAADLIEDGVNGWLLEAGDVDGLAARLDWCLRHPTELHAMRSAAEQTAAAHPWADYRTRLVSTVRAFFS